MDYNKRLDEWVTEDRLDTRKIEPPTGKVLVGYLLGELWFDHL